MTTKDRVRVLRSTLEKSEGTRAIWPALTSRFPKARIGLELAWQLGYEYGQASAAAGSRDD